MTVTQTNLSNVTLLTGVTGSGNESALVQAAIDATPDGGTLLYGGAATISIGKTLSFKNRKNITFACISPFPMKAGPQGTLNWIGPAGGTVVSLDHAFYCALEGWFIKCNDADVGVSIDGDPSGDLQLTSGNRLENLSIQNSNNRPTWAGCAIARNSTSNCELMIFRHCSFESDGKGIGLHQGSHGFNAHAHLIDSCHFLFCDTGYYQENGGVRFTGINNFSHNRIGMQLVNGEYPTDVEGCNSEDDEQFAVVGVGNAPVRIRGCRIGTGAPAGKGIIEVRDSAILEISGNGFDTAPSAGGFIYDFSGTNSVAAIIKFNNRYVSPVSIKPPLSEQWNKIITMNEFDHLGDSIGIGIDSIPTNPGIPSADNTTAGVKNYFVGGTTQKFCKNAATISNGVMTVFGGLTSCRDTGAVSTISHASKAFRSGVITVKFTSDVPPVFNTNGNLDRSCTPAKNQIVSFAYDHTEEKWSPSI